MPLGLVLRRPLKAVVSKDEARAQLVQRATCDSPAHKGGGHGESTVEALTA